MNAACHVTQIVVGARGKGRALGDKPVPLQSRWQSRVQYLAMAVLMCGTAAPAASAGLGDMLGALAASPGERGRGRSLDDALQRLAKQMNRDTPQVIDKEIRLDRVSAEPGTELVYHYTLLGRPAAELPADVFYGKLAPAVRTKLCQDPQMQKLLDSGAWVAFSYRGSDGRDIGKLSYRQRDCADKG
ncbi:MAG: hypothetical protein Q7U14_13290 [Lacisediminimonas sp.]|nr:hypothetical protein [Lacisediminimonas sp.]